MRVKGPRASVRACSYHASPGACQANVLCTGLWMIYVNTLVNRSTAVDECCCGKVDNRCDTGSCQVTGRPRPTGRYAVSTGEPARPPRPLLWEGAKQSRRGHEKVPMSHDPATTGDSKPPGGDWGGAGDVHGGQDRYLGVLPVRPPATGNHCLKGLPVHRSVLFAGCPGQGGRHAASREFPGRISHAPALE